MFIVSLIFYTKKEPVSKAESWGGGANKHPLQGFLDTGILSR